ncbi:Reverse transcriptase domain [Cinara cedri]|uniref:Reverse transcriptase domain n=1 Tax=Cinara cedri TaxID=506608 RepID=A0A5E4MQQ0_9HEMI|nr:Reverse transcriptase domain [Cinara cedri]
MFILRQIIQKRLEFDKEVHVLFVDFRKAYDSIHRESLLNILKDFKFPRKIINLIGTSLNHTDIQVKIGNVTSQPTRVTTGLRQGDALSPLLFNLVLERVIREMNISKGVILGQIRNGMLAYADDIALLGEDLDMIKRLGKYLLASRRNRNGGLEQYIKIEELKFKRVSQFKFLGPMITEDNDIKTEVSTRIQLANRGYYGLEDGLKDRN